MLSWIKSHDLLRRRPWLFIGIALAARAIYSVMAVHELGWTQNPGWLYVESGDAALYLDPVDNLIANGVYYDDYRMPGVGAPYFILRQFLGPEASRQALVIAQWLLSGLTSYLLAMLAWRFSGSHRAGLVVFAVYLASAFSAWYDPVISSDSLSVSSLILHAWFLDRGIEQKRPRLLLVAGLFMAWLVFLRPIAVLLIPLSAFVAWWFSDRKGRWRMGILVLAPFLFFDSIWIARNWQVNHRFRPLTNQGYQPDYFMREARAHVMLFIQGYGGSYIWWAPWSDARWFGIWKGGAQLDDEGRQAGEPPEHAYVEGYDRDSLFAVSERIRYIASGAVHGEDSLRAIAEVNARLDRYSALFQEKAPFQYHVMSRLRMLRNILAQNGTETMILRPFGTLPFGLKVFKVAQAGLFISSFALFWVAVLVLGWRWRKEWTPLRLFILGATLYLTLIFPLGMRMCEWRYLVMQYPFVILISTCFVLHLMQRMRRATAPA